MRLHSAVIDESDYLWFSYGLLSLLHKQVIGKYDEFKFIRREHSQLAATARA